eukprot:6259237-Prymnesium_polylepis.1
MTQGKETQRGNRVARARATQPNARTPHSRTDCAIVTIFAVLPRALLALIRLPRGARVMAR